MIKVHPPMEEVTPTTGDETKMEIEADIWRWRSSLCPKTLLHVVDTWDNLAIPDEMERTHLHIVGRVSHMEGETYHFGDVVDEEGQSLLGLPLLRLSEGRRVEVQISLLEDSQ